MSYNYKYIYIYIYIYIYTMININQWNLSPTVLMEVLYAIIFLHYSTNSTSSVLDGGTYILLANLLSPKMLGCSYDLPIVCSVQIFHYAIINRSLECNCHLEYRLPYLPEFFTLNPQVIISLYILPPVTISQILAVQREMYLPHSFGSYFGPCIIYIIPLSCFSQFTFFFVVEVYQYW